LELLNEPELLKKHLVNAANLSDYATTFRYTSRTPSVEEMESAFIFAESIVKDIEKI